MTKKRLWFQDEDFNCTHPTAVFDGPGHGMHCIYCQRSFENSETYEEFRKQQFLDQENMLIRRFDAI